MRQIFIALEGLDGVGKTTCGKLLAESMNATYIATPMEPYRSLCREIDSLNDPQARFHFFLSAVLNASKVIQALLATTSVVCDRYLYTTIAYHRSMGANTKHIDINHLDILLPDHIFYLTASKDIRTQRLNSRGMTTWDKQFLHPDWHNRLVKEFSSFSMTPIDTSSLNPFEVVAQIQSTCFAGQQLSDNWIMPLN